MAAACPVTAAAPTISNLDRIGLQLGATTVLTIDGDNLLPDPKLVLGVPIARQAVKPGATASHVVVEVTLNKAITPGIYNLRVTTAQGASPARIVALDSLPQVPWPATVESLPVALTGAVASSGKLTTSFVGKAGQAILCEAEAQRLGNKLRPVIHLHDDSGRQIAWALPSPALAGDARISTSLPADGRYTVEIHDLEYAAPGGLFRLKLGTWHHVDAVFPPAVRRGQSTTVELIGNLAGQRVPAAAAGDGLVLPLPWASPAMASGLRPRALVSDLPEHIEKDGPGPHDLPAAPVAVSGRIATAGEVDRYRLDVRPGERLHLEVYADRIGAPMDAVLELRREDGAVLARVDDVPNSPDPALDFAVPPDLKKLIVAVMDAHGRGQADFIYRVVVQPAVLASAARDFQLFVQPAEMTVPIGGTRMFEVEVERAGYAGPTRLAFDQLPAGVKAEGLDVPAGATGALVVLRGTGTAPGNTLTTLRGTSTDPQGPPLTRRAEDRNYPLRKLQPWLAEELAVALAPPEKLTFTSQIGAFPAATQLVPGVNLKVPLACTLPKGDFGGVRWYLLSSHQPPRVNGQPDANQALRKDAGPFLELPAGNSDGEFVVVVPATLPSAPVDLAFRAERLSKDRAQVVAQAFTPVRRFEVLNPLLVQAAAAQVEAILDPARGAEVKLAGKVQRRGGFAAEVTITLVGLPPGVAPPSVVLKPGQADYQLVLRLPPTFKPQDLDKVEISATGRFAPTSPLVNKSDPVTVRVKLVPAPPAPKK